MIVDHRLEHAKALIDRHVVDDVHRLAGRFDPETTTYIAVGKRAAQFVARTRGRLVAEFTITDSPRFAEARPIAAFVRDLFLKREVDEVHIAATRFLNTMSQQPFVVPYLPIGEITGLPIPGVETEADLAADMSEVTFEPNPNQSLDRTMPSSFAGADPRAGLSNFVNTFYVGGPSPARLEHARD